MEKEEEEKVAAEVRRGFYLYPNFSAWRVYKGYINKRYSKKSSK